MNQHPIGKLLLRLTLILAVCVFDPARASAVDDPPFEGERVPGTTDSTATTT